VEALLALKIKRNLIYGKTGFFSEKLNISILLFNLKNKEPVLKVINKENLPIDLLMLLLPVCKNSTNQL
jgi:hypothetical protein